MLLGHFYYINAVGPRYYFRLLEDPLLYPSTIAGYKPYLSASVKEPNWTPLGHKMRLYRHYVL